MMGENSDSFECLNSEVGIIPRFCHELFHRIAQKDGDSENKLQKNWKVEITYYEVYNEKIHDLLDECDVANKKCLRVREHPSLGPYVEDIAIKEVNSLDEVLDWLKIGNKQRFTASTEMNEKSSRSHSIFSLTLTQTQTELVMGETMINTRSSRCNLIDLAGSERVSQTCSSGERRKEGVSINQSLLTLGKVISALAENGNSRKCFAPYRESVLTFLLKESLGGNSRTVMLATISPASIHIDETLATLRYACQARKIVNRVRVNEVPQISLIRTLTEEVARLMALKEQHEMQLKGCHLGSQSREELEKLQRQYDEHMNSCAAAQGECSRLDCAEARQLRELRAAECRSHHEAEVDQLRSELEKLRQQIDVGQSSKWRMDVDQVKGELDAVREEYDTHLKTCQADNHLQLEPLREELQRVNVELAELKRSGVADELRVLKERCLDWEVKYTNLKEELNEFNQKYKQQEMELCENKLQHVKQISHFGSEVDNFKMQLKTIHTRINDFPYFENPLPAYDHEVTLDLYRSALLKKLSAALTDVSTTPSACEFSVFSSEETPPALLFAKDDAYTVNEADSSSPHLNITVARLSSGTDDTNDSENQTQSFSSQNTSSSGHTEETLEEILYYLQDKCNRLKELCTGEDVAAVISNFDHAVSELKEVLQTSSTWDLSHHFTPPSPSVTPAKSSLRSPAASRVPTPKSVKFNLYEDT